VVVRLPVSKQELTRLGRRVAESRERVREAIEGMQDESAWIAEIEQRWNTERAGDADPTHSRELEQALAGAAALLEEMAARIKALSI
jgi:hypothetical protein